MRKSVFPNSAEQPANKPKYTSFNVNSLLPKQKPSNETAPKGFGSSRMQVLGKSSVLSRVAPKVPLPFNLPSIRKETEKDNSTAQNAKNGKESTSQIPVETAKQEQSNSYATVAASKSRNSNLRYSPTVTGKVGADTVEQSRGGTSENRTDVKPNKLEPEKVDIERDSEYREFPNLSSDSSTKETSPVLPKEENYAVEGNIREKSLERAENRLASARESQDVRKSSETSRMPQSRRDFVEELAGHSSHSISPDMESQKLMKDTKRVLLKRNAERSASSRSDFRDEGSVINRNSATLQETSCLQAPVAQEGVCSSLETDKSVPKVSKGSLDTEDSALRGNKELGPDKDMSYVRNQNPALENVKNENNPTDNRNTLGIVSRGNSEPQHTRKSQLTKSEKYSRNRASFRDAPRNRNSKVTYAKKWQVVSYSDEVPKANDIKDMYQGQTDYPTGLEYESLMKDISFTNASQDNNQRNSLQYSEGIISTVSANDRSENVESKIDDFSNRFLLEMNDTKMSFDQLSVQMGSLTTSNVLQEEFDSSNAFSLKGENLGNPAWRDEKPLVEKDNYCSSVFLTFGSHSSDLDAASYPLVLENLSSATGSSNIDKNASEDVPRKREMRRVDDEKLSENPYMRSRLRGPKLTTRRKEQDFSRSEKAPKFSSIRPEMKTWKAKHVNGVWSAKSPSSSNLQLREERRLETGKGSDKDSHSLLKKHYTPEAAQVSSMDFPVKKREEKSRRESRGRSLATRFDSATKKKVTKEWTTKKSSSNPHCSSASTLEPSSAVQHAQPNVLSEIKTRQEQRSSSRDEPTKTYENSSLSWKNDKSGKLRNVKKSLRWKKVVENGEYDIALEPVEDSQKTTKTQDGEKNLSIKSLPSSKVQSNFPKRKKKPYYVPK